MENRTVSTIASARQTKHFLALTSAELIYISQCTSLNDAEKLLWINFADMTKLDSHLKVATTHKQLAARMGKSQYSMNRLIRGLREKGFVKVEQSAWNEIVYTLCLPEDALSEIERAPNRKVSTKSKEGASVEQKTEPHEKSVEKIPPCKLAAPTLQTCKTTPYIYNNNNKHNINITESEQLDDNSKVASNVMSLTYDEHLKLAAIEAAQTIALERQGVHKESTPKAASFDLSSARDTDASIKISTLVFENQTYLIEDSAKTALFSKLPQLADTGKIAGDAAKRSLTRIFQEVLYYVTRTAKSKNEQSHKLNIALSLIKQGNWQPPIGMTHAESKLREEDWKVVKQREIAWSGSSESGIRYAQGAH